MSEPTLKEVGDVTTSDAVAREPVKIPVRVECRLSKKGDGAWWNIVDIVDERHNLSLGDSNVYEFDAEYGMPDRVIEYILTSLGESGEFDDIEASYFVDIRFRDGGNELGWSMNSFTGHETLDWPFREQS
ncbi:MAG: hypothetical protein AB7Q37_10980 [Pyrinomonadaceae bacterium]